MARPWLVPVLLLLVPGAAAHGADPTVWVPDTVLGDGLPYVVEKLEPGETSVTLTVGTVSTGAVDVTGLDAASGVLSGVPAGLQAWSLTVGDGTTTHALAGHVHVQQPFAPLQGSLDALATALAGVVADVDALQAAASSSGSAVDLSPVTSQLSSLESRLAQVEGDLDAVKAQTQGLGGLDAGVGAVADAVAQVQAGLEEDGPPATASISDPVGRAGTMTTLLLVLGLGGFVAFSQVQAQRRRREAMVLLLALAARMQVSPESEEFRSAVEALEA